MTDNTRPFQGSNSVESMTSVPAISSMTLECYAEMYEALTKGDTRVQAVPLVEEAYYKISDLKQARSFQITTIKSCMWSFN